MPLWLPGYEASFGPLNPTTRAAPAADLGGHHRPPPPTHAKTDGASGTGHHQARLPAAQPDPLGTNQWDQDQPGFLEADTVAHCGASMAGQFANSLDCVDIATTWTEQRAVWGRGEQGVLQQLQDIEESLPFDIRGFDCDNGAEFLNRHLVRHFTQRSQPVLFTRSRACQKTTTPTSNRKTGPTSASGSGYERFDDPALVPLLNDLYRTEWRLFHNFFCPSVKLLEKNASAPEPRKRYDTPKTPYQRVMESDYIPRKTKIALTAQFRTLNPFVLRKAMEHKLKKIFDLCYKRTLCRQRPEPPLR
ncbi:MAG: integrase [Syntrophaceae bacterium]|nr:integrase [Syntrophaceae bacterium]